MEGYHPIVAHVLTLNYLAVFAIWYFVYGTFAYNFSYEGTRGGLFLPLHALADDLSLQLPGRKAAFIRKQVDQALDRGHSGGYLGGSGEDWSYENIRANDLYAKVGSAMLPGPIYAFVITAPLLYPVYLTAWKSFFQTWSMTSYEDPKKIPRIPLGIFYSVDSREQRRRLTQLSDPPEVQTKRRFCDGK